MPLTMHQAKMLLPLVQDVVTKSDNWLILADLIEDQSPRLAERIRQEPWLPDAVEVLRLGDYRGKATAGRVVGVLQSVASTAAERRKEGAVFLGIVTDSPGFVALNELERKGLLPAQPWKFDTKGYREAVRLLCSRAHCLRLLEQALRGETVPTDVDELATDAEMRGWNLILKGAY